MIMFKKNTIDMLEIYKNLDWTSLKTIAENWVPRISHEINKMNAVTENPIKNNF